MPEVIKSATIIGLVGALEANYGSGGSPNPATNGIQLADTLEATVSYAYDGTRTAPPGTRGLQRRAFPNGRTMSLPVKVELKGPGVAYSASVRPSYDVLARVGALDAAVTTTSGAEKVVYSPTPGPNGYGSGVFYAYARGELYLVTGAYGDWEIGGDDTGVVFWTSTIQGFTRQVSDQLIVPTITYPYAAVLPPTSVGTGLFSLGSFATAVLRSWKLKMGLTISARRNQNSSLGTAGFAIGRRTPTLEVTYETPLLATAPYTSLNAIDPYMLYETAAEIPWDIQIGATPYNTHVFAGSKAQIMSPPQPPKTDGDVAVTTLTMQLNPSAANLNDEFSITAS